MCFIDCLQITVFSFSCIFIGGGTIDKSDLVSPPLNQIICGSFGCLFIIDAHIRKVYLLVELSALDDRNHGIDLHEKIRADMI